jgi:DNA-binding NarL/FixJ family response regulator
MRAVDPQIAVLLMSGHTVTDDVQSALDAGARAFVPKPHSLETLARMLAVAISPDVTPARQRSE